MKKIIISVLLCLFMILLGCNYKQTITVSPAIIEESGDHAENRFQFAASVWMTMRNDVLYFYPHCKYASKYSEYDGWFCALSNDGVEKLYFLGAVDIIGADKQFLYYQKNSEGLFCYNYDSRSEQKLRTEQFTIPPYYREDGVIEIPLNDHQSGMATNFLRVKDGKAYDLEPTDSFYRVGEQELCIIPEIGFINAYGGGNSIYTRTSAQTWKELELKHAWSRTVTQVRDGILIHNRGEGDLIYYIESNGNLSNLFSVPLSYSDSALTVCNDNIYISVKERNLSGNWEMPRQDPLIDGLYRINLSDGSIKKLTNKVYDGLYCFNDFQIIACDENCNIFLLNTNGETIDTLFQVVE